MTSQVSSDDMERSRHKTRQIHVGSVAVGGGAPVSIQTMAKADPMDTDTIVSQFLEAKDAGCTIGRIAVPDMDAVGTIGPIRERSSLPIVADIHFDYKLAIASAKAGADALRINPGNLGGREKLEAVVDAAGQEGIPIRIGVNAGSLPKTKGGRAQKPSARAMVQTALDWIADVQDMGFENLKVSLKAFDVPMTVEAYSMFASESDIPLHLGITEAGPPLAGAVRSTAALAQLLPRGIGDTIRISLSGPPVTEVRVGRYLLIALGLLTGPQLVSCPTCGRTKLDLSSVAKRIEGIMEKLDIQCKVAVMGCEVNGPGEARTADVGIAYGSGGRGALFASGEVIQRMENDKLEEALVMHLEAMARGMENG